MAKHSQRVLTMSVPIKSVLDEDLIKTSDVAAMCGVAPGTVARWRTKARAQPLAFHCVGGRRLYRKADVLAFIDAGRQKPAKD